MIKGQGRIRPTTVAPVGELMKQGFFPWKSACRTQLINRSETTVAEKRRPIQIACVVEDDTTLGSISVYLISERMHDIESPAA